MVFLRPISPQILISLKHSELQTSTASMPMENWQQVFDDSFSYRWQLTDVEPSFDSVADGYRLSLDTQDGGAFIEMDPKLISMRWANDSKDFDFGLPHAQSPALVHADQLFSDGLLLPLHHLADDPPEIGETSAAGSHDHMSSVMLRSLSVDSSKSLLARSNRFRSRYFYAAPSRPVSPSSYSPRQSPVQGVMMTTSTSAGSSTSVPSGGVKPKLLQPIFGGYAKSSKKFLHKYVGFLLPFCKKVKGLGSIGIFRAMASQASSAGSCMESMRASPRPGDASTGSNDDWCRRKRVFDTSTETDTAIQDAVLHCKNSIGS